MDVESGELDVGRGDFERLSAWPLVDVDGRDMDVESGELDVGRGDFERLSAWPLVEIGDTINQRLLLHQKSCAHPKLTS